MSMCKGLWDPAKGQDNLSGSVFFSLTAHILIRVWDHGSCLQRKIKGG